MLALTFDKKAFGLTPQNSINIYLQFYILKSYDQNNSVMETQQEGHTNISDKCTKWERYTTYIPFETVCMNLRSAGVRSVESAEC